MRSKFILERSCLTHCPQLGAAKKCLACFLCGKLQLDCLFLCTRKLHCCNYFILLQFHRLFKNIIVSFRQLIVNIKSKPSCSKLSNRLFSRRNCPIRRSIFIFSSMCCSFTILVGSITVRSGVLRLIRTMFCNFGTGSIFNETQRVLNIASKFSASSYGTQCTLAPVAISALAWTDHPSWPGELGCHQVLPPVAPRGDQADPPCQLFYRSDRSEGREFAPQTNEFEML